MSEKQDPEKHPRLTPQFDIWHEPAEPVGFATPVFPDEEFKAGSVVGYASTKNVLRPMSVNGARWVCVLSCVPAVVGLSTLLLYWLTAIDEFAQFGMIWLLIGGGLTAVLGITSIVLAVQANRRRPIDRVAKYYGWAIAAILFNIMSAFACVTVGASFVEYAHPHIRVTNSTPTLIDHLTVHFPGRDVHFSNLAPGRSEQSGFVWLNEKGGEVEITVTIGSQTRRKVDRKASSTNLRVDPFEIIVEPEELPVGKTP